jgi:hypothetical protein
MKFDEFESLIAFNTYDNFDQKSAKTIFKLFSNDVTKNLSFPFFELLIEKGKAINSVYLKTKIYY